MEAHLEKDMTFNSIHISTLKDAIFIESYLGTHQLILGGLWNLYGAGMYFQKFLNKPMQRERDFGRFKYFSKISYPSSPLKVIWIPLSMQFLYRR